MAELTEGQAAVYDRQIRLWGVQVQKRLLAAKVLLVGCESGVAAEVAKNIVLAGVGSLAVVASAGDENRAPGNFLVPADSRGPVAEASAAALREMNPFVAVASVPDPAAGPSGDPAGGEEALADAVGQYHVVVLANQPLALQLQYGAACRKRGVALIAACSRGATSYFFSDLGPSHAYTPTDVGELKSLAGSPGTARFTPLRDALLRGFAGLHAKRTHKLIFCLLVCAAFEHREGRFPAVDDLPALRAQATEACSTAGLPPEKALDDGLLQAYVGAAGELPPVSAVLGGVAADEVVKAVSGRGAPLNNAFCYCLADGAGMVERL